MTSKDKIYQILIENAGSYCSGQSLAQQLGITRAAVWKIVKTLQEESNVPILARNAKGYCIPLEADLLIEPWIRKFLHTKALGKVLYTPIMVDSTNQECKRLALQKAPHGTVVAADGQSAGRGRMGRTFHSPVHTGLYFSVLLREKWSMPLAQQVTCCAAVAVAEAIEALYQLPIQIKWVNDLLYQGKKLCGILTEAAWNCEEGSLDYLVIGIGINVRQTTVNFPPELQAIATSLEESGSPAVQRSELLAEILNRLEEQLEQLPEHGYLDSYRSHSCLIGKPVTVYRGSESLTGTAIDIAEDGGLMLQMEDGTVQTLQSGEVTLQKNTSVEPH